MLSKPFGRALDDALQCAGLLEEMGGAGDDVETVPASEQLLRAAIEFNHAIVQPPDDQQCRRLNPPQRVACKIWPTAARDDGGDAASVGRRDERGSSRQCSPRIARWASAQYRCL